MTNRNRNDRYRIVDPRGHRVPLFIRLCEAFVDNIAQLLRLGLVVGALFLVQDLAELGELITPGDDAALASDQAGVIDPPEPAGDAEEQWLTDGVRHALNCTHTDYRNDHYDECVEEDSKIYRRPGADPDDTGFMSRPLEVLYARLATN